MNNWIWVDSYGKLVEDHRNNEFSDLLKFIKETAKKVKEWPEWERSLLGLKIPKGK